MEVSNQEGISINELSELINISPTTLRNWENYFSIPVKRTSRGSRRYDEDVINIFKNIQNLITEGNTLQNVKALLGQLSLVEEKEPEIFANFQNFNSMLKPFVSEINRKTKEIEKKDTKIQELMDQNSKLTAELEFAKLRFKPRNSALTRFLGFFFKD